MCGREIGVWVQCGVFALREHKKKNLDCFHVRVFVLHFTTARLASHDLGTPMKWPKMSMHDETARRPDGMVTMHVSCKRIDHQSTQSDGMPCMMHDPRQPLETPNFRYAGRDFSN